MLLKASVPTYFMAKEKRKYVYKQWNIIWNRYQYWTITYTDGNSQWKMGAIALSYPPLLLLMTHHEKTQLKALPPPLLLLMTHHEKTRLKALQ